MLADIKQGKNDTPVVLPKKKELKMVFVFFAERSSYQDIRFVRIAEINVLAIYQMLTVVILIGQKITI